MKTIFKGKKIEGILSVVPQKEVLFEDEVSNYVFAEKQTLKLKKLMGYEKHRIVKDETASSDLCIAGFDHILSEKWVKNEDIGAIVVVSSTPDYQLPGISSIIHGHYNFGYDVMCFDLMQGCMGFIQGLIQSFMILEHMDDKKIALFNVDVLSKKVSKQDRNSYPLIGDAAAITIVSNDKDGNDIYINSLNDGKRYESLIIPAGGSRMPCSAETAEMKDMGKDGNFRCLDNLVMNGTGVFEFVQADVPSMIFDILSYANCSISDIDWMLFHQPNKFMLKKLAEKLEVPYEKVPMNIVENFGNSSGVCVPLNITFNLGKKLTDNSYKCCLSAFGSGLSWGAIIMDLGYLNFCDLLVSNC